MPIISTPPPVTLTPEQVAAQAVAETINALVNGSNNLAACIAMTRKAGAKAIYGNGVSHADAVFAALGTEGVALVVEDLRLRAIQEAHEAGSGTSPVPADMDILPLDAQGNPTADLNAAVVIHVVAK